MLDRRRGTTALALVLGLTLSACGDDGGEPTGLAGVVVDTVDGVETLRVPDDAGAAAGWRMDTVAVIGAAPGEDGLELGSVPDELGVAADGRGTLFVLDPSVPKIFAFDTTGALLAEFGSGGRGPGELQRPGGTAVGPGDSVWVYDLAQTRITRYAPDGSGAATLAVSFAVGPLLPHLHPLTGGHLQEARVIPGVGPGSAGTGSSQGSDLLLRFGREGRALDTLWASPRPRPQQVRVESPTGGTAIMLVDRQYAPELRWAGLSGGGVVVADSARYVLHLVGLDGARKRRVVRDLPPREVTADDRRRALERFGGGIEDEETRKRTRDELTFAEVVPRVTDLEAAPDGGFWVGVSLDDPDRAGRIDVYGPRARPEASVSGIPFPHAFVTADILARVVRGELGVSRILLYRVARSAPAE